MWGCFVTDNRARAARTDVEDERRIAAIVDRKLREWGKVGLPPGNYETFLWDGYRIVGAAAASSARNGFLIKRDSTYQSISTATWTTITFDTVEYDTAAYVGTPTFTELSLSTSLIWLINIDLHWGPSGWDATSGISFETGASSGSRIYEDARRKGTGADGWHSWTFISYHHTAATHVEVYQNSGSSQDVKVIVTAQALCPIT